MLGGGLVDGAVVLFAGEPGIGKSTLLLDVAARTAAAGRRVLYVSAEESAAQVRLRAERIGALHDRLLSALRETLPDAPSEGDLLLSWLVSRQHARSEIAALARRLDGWADAGDMSAVACLTQAAEELAAQARAARNRLPDLGSAWSVAGSFTRSWTVRHVLKRELGAEHFRQATLPPLGGAALVAARTAGWPVTPAWVERLTAELQ